MILIWPLAFALISLPLFHGPSNRLLELAMENHQHLTGGFVFLAGGLLGETLKARTAKREISPAGLFWLAGLWWLCGAAAALMFPLINLGVNWSQALGLLPGGGFSSAARPLLAMIGSFFFTGPLFTSLGLNFLALPLWTVRRVILSAASFKPQYFWPQAETSLNLAVKTVNWSAFVKSEAWRVVLIKVPLLTLVVMMPEKYWLYLSGWLLIVLIMIEDISGSSGGGGKRGRFSQPPK